MVCKTGGFCVFGVWVGQRNNGGQLKLEGVETKRKVIRGIGDKGYSSAPLGRSPRCSLSACFMFVWFGARPLELEGG